MLACKYTCDTNYTCTCNVLILNIEKHVKGGKCLE